MTPLISVILTTYNRSSILKTMIDAILNQTFDDFELIIVNDGSTDDTDIIIKKYANQNSHIIAISKPNGGLSSARNAGLDKARGKYITFVDDDDFVRADYLEVLLRDDLNKFDLVIDSYSNQLDNNKPIQVHFPKAKLASRNEALKYIFGELQKVPYCFFAVAKRFKLDIIRKYNIRFSSKIKFVEDRPFVLDYLRHTESMAIIDSGAYIVKTSGDAQYRLSNGVKPADYLCYNILESYRFLCNYAQEMEMDRIYRYADNYLIDKIYIYLLCPLSTGLHPDSASKLIISTFKPFLHKINKNNVKNKQYLLFLYIFIHIHSKVAINLIRFRQGMGKLLKKLVKP